MAHGSGRALAATAVLATLAGLAACGTDEPATAPTPGFTPYSAPTPTPTPVATNLYADPESLTARAAAADPRFAALAAVPQGKWLSETPTSPARVSAQLGSYLAGADAAGATPVVVVYEIPDRDCGAGLSGGGLGVDEYLPWIDAVASLLAGRADAIVILEPDALGHLEGCADTASRLALLRGAVERLVATGARVYLDAGNSAWLDPATVATHLRDAGVGLAAGFSLNVSNFNPSDQEVRYGEALRWQLWALGVGADHSHYVIDTGRNGAAVPAGAWCNPPEARLGSDLPTLFTGTGLDAFLWVKPPGESDGSCNGGPAWGFSPALAEGLLGIGPSA